MPEGTGAFTSPEDIEAFDQMIASQPVAAAIGAFEGLSKPCPDCVGSVLQPTEAPSERTVAARCPACGGVWIEAKSTPVVAPAPAPVPPPAPAPVPPPGPAPVPPPGPLSVDGRPSLPEYLPVYDPAHPDAVAAPTPDLHLDLPPVDADDAWRRLEDGNRRFVEARPLHPHSGKSRLEAVEAGQSPIALVVGCSDARVPPEIVFDQGIGDLFVIRVAGHVLDVASRATLLFAFEQLAPPVVVILGHSGCAAVQAALSEISSSSAMSAIVPSILPAVRATEGMPGSHWDNAGKRHVVHTVEAVRAMISTHLGDSSAEGRVIGAFYDLHGGVVERLPEPTVPSTPLPPMDPPRTMGLEPLQGSESGADIPVPEPDAIVQAPASSSTPPIAYNRWCPKCRTGYTDDVYACEGCSVLLVQSWYRVPCPNCFKENPIGDAICWNCRAALHPSTRPTVRRRRPPPLVRVRSQGPSSSSGCGASVMLALIVWSAALLAMLR